MFERHWSADKDGTAGPAVLSVGERGPAEDTQEVLPGKTVEVS